MWLAILFPVLFYLALCCLVMSVVLIGLSISNYQMFRSECKPRGFEGLKELARLIDWKVVLSDFLICPLQALDFALSDDSYDSDDSNSL